MYNAYQIYTRTQILVLRVNKILMRGFAALDRTLRPPQDQQADFKPDHACTITRVQAAFHLLWERYQTENGEESRKRLTK